MVKGRVSIVIPARNERFGPRTVQDLLEKATGDIEIIYVADGYWPDPPVPADKRVHLIHFGKPHSMRPAINAGAALATGQYLMKIDAHCMVDPGFDEVLKADIEDNWIVIPRRVSLDPENWCHLKTGKKPVDAHYLSYPYDYNRPGHGLHGTVWLQRAQERLNVPLDEEMSSQGSCWFMTRKHWDWLGPMEVGKYGNFVQEMQELGCKTWLGGGQMMVNKKTTYAHLHKGKIYGRGYYISSKELDMGIKFAANYWMYNDWPDRVYDMEWLIDRFWPVPGWPANWKDLVYKSGARLVV
jgi:glycosyltransferase involved in cell wall biosynthesis